jgi:hypothetical protein
MAQDIQVAVKDLYAFRDGVLGSGGSSGLLSALQSCLPDPSTDADKAPAKFKDSLGANYVGFHSASDAAQRYETAYNAFVENCHAFVAALQTLATAAGTIADNYKNAAGEDMISAKTIDDAISAVQLPKTTTQ